MQAPILLFVSDRAVLSSLQFSLSIEGFEVAEGAATRIDPATAAMLVIDHSYLSDGLAMLGGLRRRGCGTPAIALVTNPTTRMRSQAAVAGAVLIEKPLLGDELSRALRAALKPQETA